MTVVNSKAKKIFSQCLIVFIFGFFMNSKVLAIWGENGEEIKLEECVKLLEIFRKLDEEIQQKESSDSTKNAAEPDDPVVVEEAKCEVVTEGEGGENVKKESGIEENKSKKFHSKALYDFLKCITFRVYERGNRLKLRKLKGYMLAYQTQKNLEGGGITVDDKTRSEEEKRKLLFKKLKRKVKSGKLFVPKNTCYKKFYTVTFKKQVILFSWLLSYYLDEQSGSQRMVEDFNDWRRFDSASSETLFFSLRHMKKLREEMQVTIDASRVVEENTDINYVTNTDITKKHQSREKLPKKLNQEQSVTFEDINGDTFVNITGAVLEEKKRNGVCGLCVFAYYESPLPEGEDTDNVIGYANSKSGGLFHIRFNTKRFNERSFPLPKNSFSVYFRAQESGLDVTKVNDYSIKINKSDQNPAPIHLYVDLSHDDLRKKINQKPERGWVGGFSTTNIKFQYNPTPDLSSLEMLGNLENINRLDRQMSVLWPEFSWNTCPDDAEDKRRCFQMFSHDISRIGYTKSGQVYSIICPQQGARVDGLGFINVEITVTGNRGWVDESPPSLAADMSVLAQIWFSPSAAKNEALSKMVDLFFDEMKFPFSKKHAIQVPASRVGNPNEEVFPLSKGMSEEFDIPEFANHEEIAFGVGHLSAQIGAMKLTGKTVVDDFNKLVLSVFNISSGNMLQEGNVLSWNVWFSAPQKVDRKEWSAHAEVWRHSIDKDHGSPGGHGTVPRFFNGNIFKADKETVKAVIKQIFKSCK